MIWTVLMLLIVRITPFTSYSAARCSNCTTAKHAIPGFFVADYISMLIPQLYIIITADSRLRQRVIAKRISSCLILGLGVAFMFAYGAQTGKSNYKYDSDVLSHFSGGLSCLSSVFECFKCESVEFALIIRIFKVGIWWCNR